MKKLRPVTSRPENQSSENDIRGLGQSKLFNDLTPLPFLTIRNVSIETARQTSEKFNLELAKTNHEGIFFFVDEHKNTNHKEKSVMLMGAALLISHLSPKAEMFLCVENRLRNTMLESLENYKQKYETKEDLTKTWLNHTAHLTLSSEIQIFLRQAGFDIQTHETEMHFNHSELSHQTQHLLFSFQTSVQKTKRGELVND